MAQLRSAERNTVKDERLVLALKASRMGIWEWEIPSNKLRWSDEVKMLFGLQPEAPDLSFEQYHQLLHPKDAPVIEGKIRDALEHGTNYRVEHRIIWPDGSVHWVLGQGRAFKDPSSGKPVRMVGTVMNIDGFRQLMESQKMLEAQAAALTEEHAKLVALNSAKDDFISLASHQLRTPATSVKQYLGMLLDGYAGELTPGQMEMLKTAYESNEWQLRIVDDLLRVARVDSGKIELERQPTNMARLLMRVIGGQRATLEDRGQRLLVRIADPDITAHVDADRLRMVLDNLIDNASKYTPTNKQIIVELLNSEGVIIRVIDEGVGISKKDMHKLFQKFSRISNALSAAASGTGLGLYWAKKIVDLHGGQINIDSRPNKGTTFEVVLPVVT